MGIARDIIRGVMVRFMVADWTGDTGWDAATDGVLAALNEAGLGIMPPSNPWQPIDAAPKPDLHDDTMSRYLLGFIPPDDPDEYVKDWRSLISVIWWEPTLQGGCWASDAGEGVKPTHWKWLDAGERPLP